MKKNLHLTVSKTSSWQLKIFFTKTIMISSYQAAILMRYSRRKIPSMEILSRLHHLVALRLIYLALHLALYPALRSLFIPLSVSLSIFLSLSISSIKNFIFSSVEISSSLLWKFYHTRLHLVSTLLSVSFFFLL